MASNEIAEKPVTKELEQIVMILRELGDDIDIETCPRDPLELMRGLINELNGQILELVAERQQYKVNKENYENTNPKRYGHRDKIFLSSRYIPCLEKVCKQGNDSPEDFEKCLEIDRKLMPLIQKRIMYGWPVGVHKELWDLATHNPEREGKVKESMIKLAQEKGYKIDPDKIRGLFQQLMDMNKAVQRVYRKKVWGFSKELSEAVYTLRVNVKDHLEFMKREWLRQAQRKAPGQYIAKVKEEDNRGDITYVIEIHRV